MKKILIMIFLENKKITRKVIGKTQKPYTVFGPKYKYLGRKQPLFGPESPEQAQQVVK